MNMKIEKKIVKMLEQHRKRGLSAADIANELGLRGQSRKRLKRNLANLVAQGDIVNIRHGRYILGDDADLFTGRLVTVRSGNGFVDAVDGSEGQSVFVASRDMGRALSGDTVLVRLYPHTGDDSRGPSGKVIRIIERGRHDIVGTLRSTGRFLNVVPIDPSFTQNFYVPDAMGAEIGDRVLIRFLNWENRHVSPEAEIIEVLGPADNPSVDTISIIRHYGLRDEFPEEVLREAEAVSAAMELPGQRVDLRDDLIITIDPDSSRDFDDALSLHIDGDERVLGVHIADVSHFVRPGSALDKEAIERSTSVYLPDKVLPMLPEQLSNGVCSLNPGKDRLAFSVMLKVDAEGKVLQRWFAKTIIKSSLRLTYHEALASLERRKPESGKPIPRKVASLLKELNRLAQQFRQRRFADNALDLELPEIEIVTDGDGTMIGIRPTENDISHQLVEECMVAANEAVATELAGRKIATLARFHDEPKSSKIEELIDLLMGMGYSPGDLSKQRVMADFINRIKDDALAHHVHIAVLKSMNRAVYSASQSGHYGLAKAYYSHFTSPIRRYPDLVVHRQLAACLNAQGGHKYAKAQLSSLAVHCSERENVSDSAERALTELMTYRYLERELEKDEPTPYEAVIVAVTNFGVFVELESFRVQGLVPIADLSKEFLRYNRKTGELSNSRSRYRSGDKLRVTITDVDIDARRLTFELAGRK
jgi:ribonuclease R